MANAPTRPAAEVERLAALGQVWGFLKYHHPRVASGALDWDQVLVDALPAVRDADDDAALDRALNALVDRAGPVAMGETGQTDATDATDATDEADEAEAKEPADEADTLAWLRPGVLDPALVSRLRAIRRVERTGTNHYVGPKSNVGNPEFKNERRYADTPYPSEALRLLALFRLWNVINYYYPYRHLIDDWNAMLLAFIPRFAHAADIQAYALVVSAAIARIDDGHGWIFTDTWDEIWGPRRVELPLSYIDGVYVVAGRPSDPRPSGFAMGDILVAVEGEDTATRLQQIAPYRAGSNAAAKRRNAQFYLTRSHSQEMEFTVERDGERLTIRVPTTMRGEVVETDEEQTGASYRILPGNIGLVHMGRLQEAEIEPAMTALASTRAIVFDMRAYPEFILYKLLPYLSDKARRFARFTVPVWTMPGRFVIDHGSPIGGGRERVYQGKVVILVDENTVSRAEFFAMALQTVPGAVTVGSQTAGADGDLSILPLPGDVRVGFSGIGVYYPDGGQTQRVGIRVDIEVRPTLAGLRQRRDEVLERAIRVIDESR